MAMEQGVIIMLSKAKEGDYINISSNIFEEIILDNSGKIINIEIEEEITRLTSKTINLAVDDLSLNKIKGGFIYIHFH